MKAQNDVTQHARNHMTVKTKRLKRKLSFAFDTQ
jgi:hypothetical protein